MIRRPPISTRVRSSAASDVYKRQAYLHIQFDQVFFSVCECGCFMELYYCLLEHALQEETEAKCHPQIIVVTSADICCRCGGFVKLIYDFVEVWEGGNLRFLGDMFCLWSSHRVLHCFFKLTGNACGERFFLNLRGFSFAEYEEREHNQHKSGKDKHTCENENYCAHAWFTRLRLRV